MRPLPWLVLPLVALLGGCPKTPTPEQRVAEVPARCLDARPTAPELESWESPFAPEAPAGTCVAHRFDATEALRDVVWFDDAQRPIERYFWLSEVERTRVRRQFDAQGRPTKRTTWTELLPGEAETFPEWRKPMMYVEDHVRISQKTETWTWPEGDGPPYVEVVNTEQYGPDDHIYTMAVCATHDRHGRRDRRYQVYRQGPEPYGPDTRTNRYHWRGDRNTRIDYLTANLHPNGSPKYDHAWSVRFEHDDAGRIVATKADGNPTRTQAYDEAGNLVSALNARFEWDEAGRLMAVSGLGSGMSGTYHYAGGRLVEARFLDGGGYRWEYNEHCPDAFLPDAIAPNIDGFRYYEGKDRY